MTRDEVIRGLEAAGEMLEDEGYMFAAMWVNDAITLLKEERRCDTCKHYMRFDEYGGCMKEGKMCNADWYCADWEAKKDDER